MPLSTTTSSTTLTRNRNIVVQLTASRIFTAPPYNWPAGSLGLLSLAGFIGSVLAFYLGGRLIDIISTRYTNRYGQRLPEYRLPAIIIPGVIGPGGILVFGLCIANQTHWIGAAVGYAMQAFGVAAISNVAVTYCLDCYKPVRHPPPSPKKPVSNHCIAHGRSPGHHLRRPQHNRHAAVPVCRGLDHPTRRGRRLW
jgi:MFS family permease